MSEKVVLTQEEADAIRTLRNTGAVVNLLDLKGPLSELKVHDIFKALQGWYEVEKPKFQAGDKIIHCNEIFTLEEKHSLMGSKVYWSFKEAAGTIDESYLTKAAPEEIYWLHELGRDSIGDFRIGDIFVDGKGYSYDISETDERDFDLLVSMAKDWYSEGDITGIYPAESFKPLKKEPEK